MLGILLISDSGVSSVRQHHQRLRFTSERRAQDLPAEGFIAAAQGEVSERLSPAGQSHANRSFNI